MTTPGHPPTDQEYHLDLRVWMWAASDVMVRVAAAVGDAPMKLKYQEDADCWPIIAYYRNYIGLRRTTRTAITATLRQRIAGERPGHWQTGAPVWPARYQHTCDQLGYVICFPCFSVY